MKYKIEKQSTIYLYVKISQSNAIKMNKTYNWIKNWTRIMNSFHSSNGKIVQVAVSASVPVHTQPLLYYYRNILFLILFNVFLSFFAILLVYKVNILIHKYLYLDFTNKNICPLIASRYDMCVCWRKFKIDAQAFLVAKYTQYTHISLLNS